MTPFIRRSAATRGAAALLATVCLLAALGGTPALAGDAGEAIHQLQGILRQDARLDQAVSQVSVDLRASRIGAAQAAGRWERHLAQARSELAAVGRIHDDYRRREIKETRGVIDLQIARIEGLIRAARVEAERGVEAAKPYWERQVEVYKRYTRAQGAVRQRIQYIEDNP